jgi:hypothetical protein
MKNLTQWHNYNRPDPKLEVEAKFCSKWHADKPAPMNEAADILQPASIETEEAKAERAAAKSKTK